MKRLNGRKRIAGAAGLVAMIPLLWPLSAGAGDEVDYSAPYLVVEDGELVTRYPPKDHAVAPAAAEGGSSPAAPGRKNRLWPLVATIAALVVVAAVAGFRRRRGGAMSGRRA